MLSRNKLQESGISLHHKKASDYVEHGILHERFHVTHFAGCAVLFNKDTFYPDISVNSMYLHNTRRGVQDQIDEGEHGWVLQGVLSRASFRRAATSGQKVFTVLSLHISNIYAKKRGVAKKIIQTIRALMISQNIDLVAGDFNGTAWRCRSRDNIRAIDEVFSDCALPTPGGPHTIVLTRIHTEQLDGRLWFFQAHQLSTILESEQNMAPFPFLDKLLVYVPVIKAAIMRRGFICSSSSGVTRGTIRLTTTGIFASRNGQRALEIELQNVTSAKY